MVAGASDAVVRAGHGIGVDLLVPAHHHVDVEVLSRVPSGRLAESLGFDRRAEDVEHGPGQGSSIADGDEAARRSVGHGFGERPVGSRPSA
jgi:hypothetical protein